MVILGILRLNRLNSYAEVPLYNEIAMFIQSTLDCFKIDNEPGTAQILFPQRTLGAGDAFQVQSVKIKSRYLDTSIQFL